MQTNTAKLAKLVQQEQELNAQLNAYKVAESGMQGHNLLRMKLDECMRAQAKLRK